LLVGDIHKWTFSFRKTRARPAHTTILSGNRWTVTERGRRWCLCVKSRRIFDTPKLDKTGHAVEKHAAVVDGFWAWLLLSVAKEYIYMLSRQGRGTPHTRAPWSQTAQKTSKARPVDDGGLCRSFPSGVPLPTSQAHTSSTTMGHLTHSQPQPVHHT
jgi:hypothetical protein